MHKVREPAQQPASPPILSCDTRATDLHKAKSRLRRLAAREFDWLAPSAALTLLSAVFALVTIPNYAGILPALAVLPFWLLAATLMAAILGFFAMLWSGVRSPTAHACAFLLSNRGTVGVAVICIFIAGLNMITFMWVKPLLNYAIPFWADPFLAEIDHALFLGHDPWSLLTWVNSTPTALFYHRGWFAMMILTLLVLGMSAPSPERSALMLSYFMLWSLVGPLIHLLLPAAGPVFYANLGYGSRFADLRAVPETREVAAYLWEIYAGRGFGPGSGISAMPSMHIASTAWMMLSFHVAARRWLAPMAAAAILILLLSVSLGWHYAADGLVGGSAAFFCYLALRALYRRADRRRAQLAPAQFDRMMSDAIVQEA